MLKLDLIDRREDTTFFPGAAIAQGDALDHYEEWLAPTCIISDGPYGLGLNRAGFAGGYFVLVTRR